MTVLVEVARAPVFAGEAERVDRSDVTGSLRRRSMRTWMMSFASNSKSSHEPRYGNHAGAANSSLPARMGLALVVIEEDARRAVHLAYDHALCTVHDERAEFGHERHVAHVNVLFFDVLDGLCLGFLIDLEHDEAQLHLQRRRERSCRAGGIRRRRISAASNS